MNASPQHESLLRRWIVRPLLNQLTQGSEPGKIAQAIAFGVTLGIFPLLGTPTLVSLAVGIPLRLNQPVLQLFRELSYPLHLASILVFIHVGERLYGAPHTPLSLGTLTERFLADPALFMRDFGMLGVYAVSAWLLVAPVLLAILYFIALPLVSRLARRLSPVPSHAV